MPGVLVGMALWSATALAGDTDGMPSFRHSVSLSGFLLLGSVQANFEELVAPHHGVVVEGYHAFAGSSRNSSTVGVLYRYHFRPALGGAFVNLSLRYGDVRFRTPADQEMQTTLRLAALGCGYRLQSKRGWAAVARAGYGYQVGARYEWTPSEPDRAVAARVQALQGLDLEISLGYSF